MNWFRLYHGTSTDPKLHKASRAAKVSRGLFLGAWVAVLEYASQQEQRGNVADLDAATLAYLIDCSPAVAARILAAMGAAGMVQNGVVKAWDKRQRASDDVAPRVRKSRGQARDTKDDPNAAPANSLKPNGSAEHRNVTETRRTEQNREEVIETTGYKTVSLTKPTPPADAGREARAVLWNEAKAFLGGTNPGGVIGKWCRDYGEGAFIEAYFVAVREGPADPTSRIAGILKARSKKAGGMGIADKIRAQLAAEGVTLQ